MQQTSKPYLRYAKEDFNPDVLEATNKLFLSRPWAVTESGGPEEKYQLWADRVRAALNLPEVIVNVGAVTEDQYSQTTQDDRIMLHKASVTQLFRCFHDFMVKAKVEGGSMTPQDARSILENGESWAWAYSLFYIVRPELFKTAVGKGTLPLADPADFGFTSYSGPGLSSDDEDEEDEPERDTKVVRPAGDGRPEGMPERGNCSNCGNRTRTLNPDNLRQFMCRGCQANRR